jgi:hypothetical protein
MPEHQDKITNTVTVTIGLQEIGFNDDAIIPALASPWPNAPPLVAKPGTLVMPGAYGSFNTLFVTASGNPPLTLPEIFNGNVLALCGSTGGVLSVYITSQGNTAAPGELSFLSGFTTNFLTAGWTLQSQTFLDPNNGLFALTTPLGNIVFNDVGSSVSAAFATVGAGPYSLMQMFTITGSGPGSFNATTNIKRKAA